MEYLHYLGLGACRLAPVLGWSSLCLSVFLSSLETLIELSIYHLWLWQLSAVWFLVREEDHIHQLPCGAGNIEGERLAGPYLRWEFQPLWKDTIEPDHDRALGIGSLLMGAFDQWQVYIFKFTTIATETYIFRRDWVIVNVGSHIWIPFLSDSPTASSYVAPRRGDGNVLK